VPSVKVCLWNIQNFGQPSGKYDGTGVNNALRNRFVARFIVRNNIDVVMIQEVLPGAENALADLTAKLRALCPVGQRDWAYSFCGSAIRNDDVDVVTDEDDLIDRTGARSECYGVLWRTRRTRFTMIEGIYQIAHGTTIHQQSPLNISQLGRPTGNMTDDLGAETFGATGGFTRDNVFPWEYDEMNDDYDLLDHWPQLGYPRTSIVDARRPSWSRSRRPAYVVIKLDDAFDTLCPIAAYHAPSNQQMASWGAYQAGLARELYVVDGVNDDDEPEPDEDPVLTDAGFFGGDFNYSVEQAAWPDAYRYFVDARSHTAAAGAYLTPVPPPTDAAPDRRTTVQIVTGAAHNVPIVSANTDDYLRYKIDLGFHRSIDTIAGERVDLLTEIMNNPGGYYNDPLVQAEAYMAHVEGQINNPFNPYQERLAVTGPEYYKPKKVGRRTVYTWCPLICGAWGGTFTNWATSRAQFGAHNITDARRAAEYIHIFVSDHLPLVATINF